MNEEAAKILREPFPDEVVGKLPRGTCKACSDSRTKVCERHTKEKCATCDNYMTTAHVHLDFAGHAAVTDRFLAADPEWTWEPMGFTAEGLPFIRNGCLWIRLTICGTTRPGVGNADGKTGADAEKEMIGDALRNAGMRFGVGLDLWSKQDLHAVPPEPPADPNDIAGLVARMNALADAERKQCKAMFVDAFGAPDQLRASMVSTASDMIGAFEAPKASEPSPGVADTSAPGVDADPLAAEGAGAVAGTPAPDAAKKPTRTQNGRLFSLLAENEIGDEDRHAWASTILKRDVASFTELTRDDVVALIDALAAK